MLAVVLVRDAVVQGLVKTSLVVLRDLAVDGSVRVLEPDLDIADTTDQIVSGKQERRTEVFERLLFTG